MNLTTGKLIPQPPSLGKRRGLTVPLSSQERGIKGVSSRQVDRMFMGSLSKHVFANIPAAG